MKILAVGAVFFHADRRTDIIKLSVTFRKANSLKSSIPWNIYHFNLQAPCVLYIGQEFRYGTENAFYVFNQQIYSII